MSATHPLGLQVGDGHGSRIGRIARQGVATTEQGLDHAGHLRLVGPTTPRDRSLDERRRIRVDGKPPPRRGEQHHPPDVSEHDGSPGVTRDEQILDRTDARPVNVHDLFEGLGEPKQAVGERCATVE